MTKKKKKKNQQVRGKTASAKKECEKERKRKNAGLLYTYMHIVRRRKKRCDDRFSFGYTTRAKKSRAGEKETRRKKEMFFSKKLKMCKKVAFHVTKRMYMYVF